MKQSLNEKRLPDVEAVKLAAREVLDSISSWDTWYSKEGNYKYIDYTYHLMESIFKENWKNFENPYQFSVSELNLIFPRFPSYVVSKNRLEFFRCVICVWNLTIMFLFLKICD